MAENFREVLTSIRTASDVKRYAASYNEAFASVIAKDNKAKFDQTEMYEKFIDLIQKNPSWKDLILKTQGKNVHQIRDMVCSLYSMEQIKDLVAQALRSFDKTSAEQLIDSIRTLYKNFDLGYVLSSHALIREFMDTPEGKRHQKLYDTLSNLGIMLQNLRLALIYLSEKAK